MVRNLQLDDLNGLHKRAPALAFALAVGAFALVGLPPMARFLWVSYSSSRQAGITGTTG